MLILVEQGLPAVSSKPRWCWAALRTWLSFPCPCCHCPHPSMPHAGRPAAPSTGALRMTLRRRLTARAAARAAPCSWGGSWRVSGPVTRQLLCVFFAYVGAVQGNDASELGAADWCSRFICSVPRWPQAPGVEPKCSPGRGLATGTPCCAWSPNTLSDPTPLTGTTPAVPQAPSGGVRWRRTGRVLWASAGSATSAWTRGVSAGCCQNRAGAVTWGHCWQGLPGSAAGCVQRWEMSKRWVIGGNVW